MSTFTTNNHLVIPPVSLTSTMKCNKDVQDWYTNKPLPEKRIIDGIKNLYDKVIQQEKVQNKFKSSSNQALYQKIKNSDNKYINIVHRPPQKLRKLKEIPKKTEKNNNSGDDNCCKKYTERLDRMFLLEDIRRIYNNRKCMRLPTISCIWYISEDHHTTKTMLKPDKQYLLHRTTSNLEYSTKRMNKYHAVNSKNRRSSAPVPHIYYKSLRIEGEKLFKRRTIYDLYNSISIKSPYHVQGNFESNHCSCKCREKKVNKNNLQHKNNLCSIPETALPVNNNIFPFYENEKNHGRDNKNEKYNLAVKRFNYYMDMKSNKVSPDVPPTTPAYIPDKDNDAALLFSVKQANLKKTNNMNNENLNKLIFKNDRDNIAKELLIILNAFIKMSVKYDIKSVLHEYIENFEENKHHLCKTSNASAKASKAMYRLAKNVINNDSDDEIKDLLLMLSSSYHSIKSVFETIEKSGKSVLLHKIGFEQNTFFILQKYLKMNKKVSAKTLPYLYKLDGYSKQNKRDSIFQPAISKLVHKKESNLFADSIFNEQKETFSREIILPETRLSSESTSYHKLDHFRNSNISTKISITDSVSEFEFLDDEPYPSQLEAKRADVTPFQYGRTLNSVIKEVQLKESVIKQSNMKRKTSRRLHSKGEIKIFPRMQHRESLFVAERHYAHFSSHRLDSLVMPEGDTIDLAEIITDEKATETTWNTFFKVEVAKVSMVTNTDKINEERKRLKNVLSNRRNKFDADRAKQQAENKKNQIKNKRLDMYKKHALAHQQKQDQSRDYDQIEAKKTELHPYKTKEQLEEIKRKKYEKFKKANLSSLSGFEKVDAMFTLFPDEYEAKQKKILGLATNNSGTERIDKRVQQETNVDYITNFKLVDKDDLLKYTKAFTIVDTDTDGIVSIDELKECLYGIESLDGIKDQYLHYITEVFQLHSTSKITIGMFAVIAALLEKMKMSSSLIEDAVEGLDGMEVERKINFFRDMFYSTAEMNGNVIGVSQLRLELAAGGLSEQKEEDILKHIQVDEGGDISFMDYMAYIPLFITIHNKIVENALDNSRDK